MSVLRDRPDALAPHGNGERGPGRRLRFVDNLRIALTVLVVLHHVVVGYSGLGMWYYDERPTSAAVGIGLTVFLMLNQAWFMGAFFLLSGHFTPGSYERKGARAFLRDRLVRLGIPLLVFYFVLNPILSLGDYHGGPLGIAYLHAIGSGPLWFALALLVFDACYAAVRVLGAARRGRRGAEPRRGSRLARWEDRATGAPKRRTVLGFVAALALATYVLRILVPAGFWLPVIDFPTGAYLAQYAAFFVLGTIAYRRGWFRAVTPRLGRFGAALAAGAVVVFLPLALGTGGVTGWTGHGTLSSLCYALFDSGFAVGLLLALLAVFRRRFDGQGPLRRYLARHSFTVYVTHAAVVTAAGYALAALAMPTLPKVALVALVAVPACFALAGPIRRLPGVRRVL
ncbi:acyltransferase family protein [Actinocatenispora sera]|uniref:acyltransferase family protein n=1 Tax=Actinocatenispora sera TaxID=390989 RepID=UPI003408E31F